MKKVLTKDYINRAKVALNNVKKAFKGQYATIELNEILDSFRYLNAELPQIVKDLFDKGERFVLKYEYNRGYRLYTYKDLKHMQISEVEMEGKNDIYASLTYKADVYDNGAVIEIRIGDKVWTIKLDDPELTDYSCYSPLEVVYFNGYEDKIIYTKYKNDRLINAENKLSLSIGYDDCAKKELRMHGLDLVILDNYAKQIENEV